jgi:hypothetical protein
MRAGGQAVEGIRPVRTRRGGLRSPRIPGGQRRSPGRPERKARGSRCPHSVRRGFEPAPPATARELARRGRSRPRRTPLLCLWARSSRTPSREAPALREGAGVVADAGDHAGVAARSRPGSAGPDMLAAVGSWSSRVADVHAPVRAGPRPCGLESCASTDRNRSGHALSVFERARFAHRYARDGSIPAPYAHRAYGSQLVICRYASRSSRTWGMPRSVTARTTSAARQWLEGTTLPVRIAVNADSAAADTSPVLTCTSARSR